MRLEIVTIGDELLLGFTVDTNSTFLGRELAELGVEVVRRSTVPDDQDAIVDSVREALERTGAVITTGGLGPTSDDLTCASVAATFGVPLIRDDAVQKRLEERWRARGFPGQPSAAYLRQALVPKGAIVLRNSQGTAPGLWVEDAQARWTAVLPGVPREMRAIFEEELRPRIARVSGAGERVIRSRTLRTTGVAESLLAERLSDAPEHLGELSLAYLPGVTGVDLRVTARGLPPDVADERLQAAVSWLRARAGEHAYGEDEEDLASLVLGSCRARGMRMAVAESCTGGMLGARLTAIPGSSDVFTGGVIAYSNEVKIHQLGVSAGTLIESGAVSEAVALQMATGVRQRLGAEAGIGITGVAGPGGGSEEKPVGTVWLAADVNGLHRTELVRYPGDREEVRVRAVQGALALVRGLLAG